MPSSVYPQSLTLQPHGACGFAIARRRLRCFDFLKEVSLTLQRGPEGPFQFYICLILTISLFKSVLEVIDDIVYILDAD